jgi:uncharacterized pyridoxal phosphate-containing UPF0001 family protein
MTMAPELGPGGDERPARAVFAAAARLARELESDRSARAAFVGQRVRISAGMSADFEIAIEEESDVVRIGSALFAGVPGQPRVRS